MMNAADLMKRESDENRVKIWKFFKANPCHTKAECAAALGLSSKTVGRHCQAIRQGWQPVVGTADAEKYFKYCPIVENKPRVQIGPYSFELLAPWQGWSADPHAAAKVQADWSKAIAHLINVESHGGNWDA